MHPAPASKCECPVCDQEFTRFTAGDKFYNNAFLAMSDHVANTHPEALVECPRKTNEATLPMQLKAPVFWEKDKTCSYCGSLSPERFFEAIEQGYELGPTDKSYKVYVTMPDPQAGLEWPLMSSYGDEPPSGEGWIKITEELRQRYYLDDNKGWIKLCKVSETQQAKFYFMHLSEEQMIKFIDLYNEKKLKIGFPGHFYVSPYFMKPAT